MVVLNKYRDTVHGSYTVSCLQMIISFYSSHIMYSSILYDYDVTVDVAIRRLRVQKSLRSRNELKKRGGREEITEFVRTGRTSY